MARFSLKRSIAADLPLLLGLCIGAFWVAGNYFGLIHFTTCPMKNLTGLPCPSCGSTRATMKILHGDLWEGICLNPNAIFILLFILLFPVVFYLRHSSKPGIYRDINRKMSSLWFIIPFVCLETAIWIHNLAIGL